MIWNGANSNHAPTEENTGELNLVQGLTASQYLSPSLPFCLRLGAGFRHVPYTNAAKLDTEPVANS